MAAKSKQGEGAGEEKDVLRVGLGEALREFRKGSPLKLSQGELSTQAGLPWNAIGDLERGERAIKGDELKSICQVLGVPLRAFMERVTRAQLKALGEPEAGEEAEDATPAALPDFYLTVPFAGGKAEDIIRMVDRMIKARRPASPEDDG
ncbi:MAG: helix-turn-helix domain-containing protein [Thermoanaerobaculia bacterium]